MFSTCVAILRNESNECTIAALDWSNLPRSQSDTTASHYQRHLPPKVSFISHAEPHIVAFSIRTAAGGNTPNNPSLHLSEAQSKHARTVEPQIWHAITLPLATACYEWIRSPTLSCHINPHLHYPYLGSCISYISRHSFKLL